MTRPQLAAYYFPNWHPCPRNDRTYGPGESEWKVVREAKPRFAGHDQPKVPAWGYEDESQPEVMARKIDAAANAGIDVFLYDWYWNDSGPFLEAGLERGFLNAPNRERMKFAIMWANHQPVTRATFDQAIDHIIATYFSQPNYWQIDGKPYLSLYELYTLIDGLGGIEQAQKALNDARRKVAAAGFRNLHLNLVEWGIQPQGWVRHQLPVAYQTDRNSILSAFSADSVTSYVWVHNAVMPDFPTNDYAAVASRAYEHWRRFTAEFKAPYHPNVTMGWDSWPRVPAAQPFEPGEYPRSSLITGNTPEQFRAALQAAQALTASQPQPVITLNAWNEWTEGSYLEPDTRHGTAYLDAIRDVFGIAG